MIHENEQIFEENLMRPFELTVKARVQHLWTIVDPRQFRLIGGEIPKEINELGEGGL